VTILVKSRLHVRICAGFLAVLGVLTPVATALHGAFESHAYCTEHGAFEEGASGQSDLASHNPGQSTESAPASVHVLLTGDDSHDDCPFAQACFRDALASRDTAEPTAIPAIPQASLFACLEAPAAANRVLALAPKTSPPRV
jgi:hypothetical protein